MELGDPSLPAGSHCPEETTPPLELLGGVDTGFQALAGRHFSVPQTTLCPHLNPGLEVVGKQAGRSRETPVSDMFALFKEPPKKVKGNLKTVYKIYL